MGDQAAERARGTRRRRTHGCSGMAQATEGFALTAGLCLQTNFHQFKSWKHARDWEGLDPGYSVHRTLKAKSRHTTLNWKEFDLQFLRQFEGSCLRDGCGSRQHSAQTASMPESPGLTPSALHAPLSLLSLLTSPGIKGKGLFLV